MKSRARAMAERVRISGSRRHRGTAGMRVRSLLTGAALAALGVTGWGISATGPAHAAERPPSLTGAIGGHEVEFTEVGGIETRYYEAGSGEPMVLLHGGGGSRFNSANVWSRNIDDLAERFHVLAPDRLGAGLTGFDPDGDQSYARQVEFVRAFIETLDLGPVHLVGHSSGGAVASLFALTHPELVETLVVLTTGPQMPRLGLRKMDIMGEACENLSGYVAWQCRLNALTWRPDVAWDETFWEASQRMTEVWQRRREEALADGGEPREGREFWEAQWERVRAGGHLQMPILLICGKQDAQDWHPPDDPSEMRRCRYFFDVVGSDNAQARLLFYNDAGHFPYREQPRLFAEDVINFAEGAR